MKISTEGRFILFYPVIRRVARVHVRKYGSSRSDCNCIYSGGENNKCDISDIQRESGQSPAIDAAIRLLPVHIYYKGPLWMEKVILIRVKFGQLTFRKYLKVQESHWLKLVSFSPPSCFTSLRSVICHKTPHTFDVTMVVIIALWLNNVFSGVDCGCMIPQSWIGVLTAIINPLLNIKSTFMATVYLA